MQPLVETLCSVLLAELQIQDKARLPSALVNRGQRRLEVVGKRSVPVCVGEQHNRTAQPTIVCEWMRSDMHTNMA